MNDVRKFTMLIELGQPFPEKQQQLEFIIHETGLEFNATIWSYEIKGWETKGKIGVYILVTAWVDEIVRPSSSRSKLKVI